ncbi:hypothetical protein NDU88_005624 [Pleurodeles waltl]|uniref:Uncharacterized protein n=1 Tax=Pleurodeles waltl TaxID=8319 RepID=A0AAV7LNC8_PLEWA|nr:hypothetical protein NDU88_005624 [Pleurodeles waltl]
MGSEKRQEESSSQKRWDWGKRQSLRERKLRKEMIKWTEQKPKCTDRDTQEVIGQWLSHIVCPSLMLGFENN